MIGFTVNKNCSNLVFKYVYNIESHYRCYILHNPIPCSPLYSPHLKKYRELTPRRHVYSWKVKFWRQFIIWPCTSWMRQFFNFFWITTVWDRNITVWNPNVTVRNRNVTVRNRTVPIIPEGFDVKFQNLTWTPNSQK